MKTTAFPFLDELEAALGRLLVGGLAHPAADVPGVLTRLVDRARELGVVTIVPELVELAATTERLAPGPSSRSERMELASRMYTLVFRIWDWNRTVRTDLALELASVGEAVGAAPEIDGYSGTVAVIGAERSGDELRVWGRDETGEQVLAIDRLASVDEADPFGSPVVSRLLQQEVGLGALLTGRIRFDGHPMTRGRTGVGLRPAFASVPVLLTGDAVVSVAGQTVELVGEGPDLGARLDGAPVELSPLAQFNLRKRLCGSGSRALSAALGRHDGKPTLVRVDEPGGPFFPSLDARCWALDAAVLRSRLSPDAWATAQLGGSGVVRGWRAVWMAWRAGDAPPVVPDGESPQEGFGYVWARVLADHAPLDRLAGRYATARDLFDVASRTLLLASVPEGLDVARDYWEAHRDQLAEQVVLPSNAQLLALVAAADAVEPHDAPGDALALDTRRCRARWVRSMEQWLSSGVTEDFGDALALGAVSSWEPTVLRR